MLRVNNINAYYVYPSWGKYSYSWEQLPPLLNDPLRSRYIDSKKDWQKYGFPSVVKSASFIDGPLGGGIVVSPHSALERWLPEIIFGKEATITSPRAMYKSMGGMRVYYLEPRDEPGAEFGLANKAELYVPAVTAENIDATPDSIYWMIDFTTLSGTDALSDLPKWTEQLQFSLKRLEGMPASLAEETRAWFADSSLRFVWFCVTSESNFADYHLAVMLYFALHLRKVLGRKMRAMHLVAKIEGKPNARIGWAKR